MNLRYHLLHPFHSLKVIIGYIYNVSKFKKFSITCKLNKGSRITKKYVSLGEYVYIGPNARIEGVEKYIDVFYYPNIEIHNNVSIQQNIHLTCAEYICIGENTSIAANVTITDIDHPYTDINIPIERQQLKVKPVTIGKDCKIYNNAVILQGTIIGNHCVVGANSVVKGTYPDFSIIVGCPARIVKRFNQVTHKWQKTDNLGNFI